MSDVDKYGKTYKAQRWRITYTNELGRASNYRFTYMQMGFDSLQSAERELNLLKQKFPKKCIDEDYRVEEYTANLLYKPIYPFNDND